MKTIISRLLQHCAGDTKVLCLFTPDAMLSS